MCRTYVYTLCMLCFIYSFFCGKCITYTHRKGTALQVQFILINEYSFKNLRTGCLLYTKPTVLLSILYYDCYVYPQSVCVGKVSLRKYYLYVITMHVTTHCGGLSTLTFIQGYVRYP